MYNFTDMKMFLDIGTNFKTKIKVNNIRQIQKQNPISEHNNSSLSYLHFVNKYTSNKLNLY